MAPRVMAIDLSEIFADPQEQHELAMEAAIKLPQVAEMQPAVKRTITKLTDICFHLSPDGFNQEDPHVMVLLRNPEKHDRWRLYSLCPRTRNGGTSYRIRGDEATAIRLAGIIIDLSTGKLQLNLKEAPDIQEDNEHDEGGHDYGGSAYDGDERKH